MQVTDLVNPAVGLFNGLVLARLYVQVSVTLRSERTGRARRERRQPKQRPVSPEPVKVQIEIVHSSNPR